MNLQGGRTTWHNLAFPDSDASFEGPANYDAADGAVVFAQDNDASIDIDALGFTYSANFAVELIVIARFCSSRANHLICRN